MMKLGRASLVLSVVCGSAWAVLPQQFTSTVQLAVQEDNPRLINRAQKLVIEQFASALSTSPELRGKHYEVHTSGNQVVFYLLSNNDMRTPMQAAVANMIERLNGRVRARGRSLYYRTSWSPTSGAGYLDVVFDDTYTKVVSIAAQAVPLRDLLKEIKAQHRVGAMAEAAVPTPNDPATAKPVAEVKPEPESISYLIPGECAERLVDWNFGNDGGAAEPKSIDEVMDDVAGLFGLKCEKKDLGRSRTYILTGICSELHQPARHGVPPPPTELLKGEWIPEVNQGIATQVSFPLPPMND